MIPEDVLEWMIGMPEDRFIADVHERAPRVHAAGDRGRFDPLLTLPRLNERIAELDLRAGMIELANARQPVPRADYVQGDFIDRVAVARGYRQGATIVFNQLQHSDRRMAAFCRRLERVFSCHIQTNTYLTPPAEQGFRTHYDSHDVFILQITGSKDWRLYGDPEDAPFRGERFQGMTRPAGEPAMTFTLNPGDGAYIPRGYYHDAVNSGDAPSLHITVGLIVRTWADLMLEAVSQVCLAEPEFRRALPPGYAGAGAGADRTAMAATFAQLTATLADRVRMGAALDTITETFIRSREPDLTDSLIDSRIDPEGHYVARPSLLTVKQTETEVRVVAPGCEFNFGRAPLSLITRILDGTPFRVTDLDHAEALDVLGRLMTAGLIERQAAPAG
ncbi:cupin domain-containing protein [Brevundimonas sp.]|uniref:cupin domain-containing protein n=1 Tax=Brevundimonas sp. TaxID=1871086 RepID=UPI0024872EFB|nr:cupin domain-containing protein [Brevundimonas sp.]MDI1281245.1 cupin domain-containing protein [Brevundimonas sp.]